MSSRRLFLIFSVAISLFLPAYSRAADFQRQLWVTNAFGEEVHVFEVGTWKSGTNGAALSQRCATGGFV